MSQSPSATSSEAASAPKILLPRPAGAGDALIGLLREQPLQGLFAGSAGHQPARQHARQHHQQHRCQRQPQPEGAAPGPAGPVQRRQILASQAAQCHRPSPAPAPAGSISSAARGKGTGTGNNAGLCHGQGQGRQKKHQSGAVTLATAHRVGFATNISRPCRARLAAAAARNSVSSARLSGAMRTREGMADCGAGRGLRRVAAPCRGAPPDACRRACLR